ncbi:MAG: ATP-binding cassette domain-containing protein [Candidatus Omnitrophota bacterium]
MIKIKNLSVEVSGRTILKDIQLDIPKGQILVLFGPNGSGKTTLIRSIMGFSGYQIHRGEVLFKGKNLLALSLEERVRLGLGIMYQHPPKIRGVKLHQIARHLCKDENKIRELAERLDLKDHLDRDINLDFSGGEMKRSELFQLILQDADFLLLDEPESGVDLENISLMGKALNDFLGQKEKSALIITHTGHILDYLKAERGCVLMDGKLWCMGDPKEIFQNIRTLGYEHCKVCHERK